MKKPNDKKRPNSNSGAEIRQRKRNFKYLWVSKKILEVPVIGEDGTLTNIKQLVVEKKGRTYRRQAQKPMSKRDFYRAYGKRAFKELLP